MPRSHVKNLMAVSFKDAKTYLPNKREIQIAIAAPQYDVPKVERQVSSGQSTRYF